MYLELKQIVFCGFGLFALITFNRYGMCYVSRGGNMRELNGIDYDTHDAVVDEIEASNVCLLTPVALCLLRWPMTFFCGLIRTKQVLGYHER